MPFRKIILVACEIWTEKEKTAENEIWASDLGEENAPVTVLSITKNHK